MKCECKNKTGITNLLLILGVITIGMVGLDFLFKDLWKNWCWYYAPLHSSLEIFGTVAAILMVVVLLQRKQEENCGNLLFMILGFLSMGILKGFHAVSTPGGGFTLLSNTACLMSGFFFALVWFPHSLSDRYASKKNALLWFVIVFCILLGAYTLLFRETLPKMVHNGNITGTAISMNLLAALFFLIAGGRFLLDFYRSNNLEYYLFVYLALFWCLSCLLFRHSLFWGAEWWILHMLSLGAYLLTLFIVVRNYLETVFNLKATTSEGKITKDLLEETESKYLALVKQAMDGVIIIQDGICKFVNKTMEKITGYSAHEMMNMPFSKLIVAQCRDLATRDYNPCCLTSGKANPACEIKIQSKDKMIKEIEASTGVIQYNRKPAMLGIVRDVTERNKMQEEILKVHKLESIGILAGGIAHDFNNILQSLVGSLSLLRLQIKSGDKFHRILERAEKAASRAGDLTRQLLTFSKGGAPIRKVTSIIGLIEDTADFFLRGSTVKSEFYIADDLWPVEIDEGQISQVINNLVINARQAMPQGGIIKIGAENIIVEENDNLPLKEGEYIKVSVQDQGVGIPKECLRNIFDPYFTTKKTGSGLGLAITYSIVKKHGGHITAESEVGVGTTFCFYIPALKREIFTVEDYEEERILSGEGRILLMDDQQSVREMVGEMLNCIGYEVEFAEEGDEAIELYKKEKALGNSFDAVILDLTLPTSIGGDEVLKKLLQIDPKVKAIASSGYSTDPVMSEFKNYGFLGKVSKPYGIRELSEVLHKALNGEKEPHH